MKYHIKLSLVIISLLCLNSNLLAQNALEKIQELLEAHAKSLNPFSGSVLVAQKEKVVYRGAFGLSDLKKDTKNTIDSKYFIGSITKMFTTVAILQLVEQNKINLDDKLSKWLPEINGSEKITIHHLLTHQSGLKRDSHQHFDENVTHLERAMSVKNDTLLFKPGTKEAYSSVGFYALTYILEKISGMKYEDYFEKYIFKPSNIKNTGVRKAKAMNIDGLSIGMDGSTPDAYGVNDFGYAKYFDSYSLAGGGSLYSTIDDMYSFFNALEKGKLLSKEMVNKMKQKWPITEKRTSRLYHSYGWEVYDYSSDKGSLLMFDFAGRINGYKSMIRYYKEDDILIIALCNSDNSERSILGWNIRNILLNKEYKLPKPAPKKIPFSESMKKHLGVYDFPSEKTTVEIKIINGKMTLTSHGDSPVYLDPISENTFYSDFLPLKITFEPTAEEKTQKLEFNYDEELIKTLERISN